MTGESRAFDTSVLIVGGGPVGLALAADLGRRGVSAKLIERRTEKLGSARMIEVSVRTMELCRQLGLTDEIRNWGFPLDHSLDSVFVTNLDGFELGRVVIPPLSRHRSSPYSPERAMPCPQTWFDPILKRCAQSFPSIELHYETELEALEQDAEGVTATVACARSKRIEQVRARYLVGCDGSESFVRQRLGIQVRGQRHLDWSFNIYLRIPNFERLHRTKAAFRYIFVGPEGTWSFLTMVDGADLFRLQLIGVDRDALDSTDIPAVMRRCFGRDVPFTVEDRVLWVRKMTVADHFMDGRVFLAGDAAHAHPPNGGLGMNIGIQDAFDLGWKLAAVMQGWGGQTLLDSYDYDRRPASSRGTEVSLANYRRLIDNSMNPHIEDATPDGEAARRQVGDLLVQQNIRSWLPPGVHLGHIYSPSPVVISDDSPVPEDDTYGYRPTSYPGARAPHVWLEPQRSIIDLFGHGFTLLIFGDESGETLIRAAELRGVPLTAHRIRNPQAIELYEKRFVLVRPDGHVAWRGDLLPEDCLTLIDIVRGAGRRVAACRAEDLALVQGSRAQPTVKRPASNVLMCIRRAIVHAEQGRHRHRYRRRGGLQLPQELQAAGAGRSVSIRSQYDEAARPERLDRRAEEIQGGAGRMDGCFPMEQGAAIRADANAERGPRMAERVLPQFAIGRWVTMTT
jgi:2-polyprenyl-6-methoxyphenol hydroxylase-like FAD-dependent oxidoreductase